MSQALHEGTHYIKLVGLMDTLHTLIDMHLCQRTKIVPGKKLTRKSSLIAHKCNNPMRKQPHKGMSDQYYSWRCPNRKYFFQKSQITQQMRMQLMYQ